MDPVASADLTRPVVNQLFLKHSWSTDSVVRQEDWQRWFKTLSLGLMRESTSQALRACMSLADTHEPLAKELFNAAFYSCWVELSDQNKASQLFVRGDECSQKVIGGVCSRVDSSLD